MQITNGPRAGKSDNPQNELLEKNHGERLDFGAQGVAVADDADVATVGESDRAENATGQKDDES